MHRDLTFEAFASILGLVAIDIEGSVEIGFVGADAASDRCSINNRLEGGAWLALGLSDAVELVGFKVGTTDHGFDATCTRIDTHHCGLSEGTAIAADGGVDDFFGFGLPLWIEGSFHCQATLSNGFGRDPLREFLLDIFSEVSSLLLFPFQGAALGLERFGLGSFGFS